MKLILPEKGGGGDLNRKILMGRPNVQDLPSDPEILPDVAGCSTTQSDSGNISQSDPEFLPDDSYHPIRNSRIPYFGTNYVHM